MNKKESMKDAIWHLTCASSSLQGYGFDEIQKRIISIRDELKIKE